ncbi:sulfite exporter TauE/SafE family protein [Pseudomaricurvus alkylphenolicus]|uniref:sulfite exporter TauE/SafE family protein n=1 Tax=Pseudomaricurvus alkylphenolicus TaxID=1306991 RepID=UPI00141DB6E1|nr:sulfite exporter TauE/SafE family protein [Pseudomaricurvus alkylphenolicus]NIB38359.1 sulfite exporter TauE/SafE family protein [Pseudomaricurvus alkylphenolicus]
MGIDNSLLLISALAVLIAGVSKSGFGGGLVILAVPIVSLVAEPILALAILLPVLIFMDFVNVHRYFGKWDREIVKRIFPAALLGTMIGSLSLVSLNPNVLKLLIGALAIVFTIHHYLKLKAPHQGTTPGDHVFSSYFWGALAAFTSFTAHAGGPPLNMYLLPQRLEKLAFVATLSAFIALTNILKALSYTYMGLFTYQSLLISALLIPVAVIGTQLGFWLQQRLDEEIFYRCCYGFLLLAGFKLLASGLSVI